MAQNLDPAFKPREKHNGIKFVFLLLAFASLMGFYAFYNFKLANRVLRNELVSTESRGKDLSFEQCIDQVVAWVPQCEAMKSLCEAYSGGIMDACLRGRDRKQECVSIADRPTVSQFGYKECQARELGRALTKACANAYKALDIHCKNLALGG